MGKTGTSKKKYIQEDSHESSVCIGSEGEERKEVNYPHTEEEREDLVEVVATTMTGYNPSAEILNDPTLRLSNIQVAEARDNVANGTDRIYRIYSDGIFDLFHIGHMNVLKQAKYALGNPANVHLIVGVCSDADTVHHKGTVVIDEHVRAETVGHCKWVDEVIPNCPWVLSPEFILQHQIDFVAHDAVPYVSEDSEDVYAGVKNMGKFLATERTNGISTTDIIVQIVKDYDDYVIRNLKRGVDKKQLNVGRTWEIRAVAHAKGRKLDKNIDKLQTEKKELVGTLQALGREIQSTGIVCGLKKNKRDQPVPGSTKVLSETVNVLKHSFRLGHAVVETSLSVLSYFNIFSYIDMCRQTKSYQKGK